MMGPIIGRPGIRTTARKAANLTQPLRGCNPAPLSPAPDHRPRGASPRSLSSRWSGAPSPSPRPWSGAAPLTHPSRVAGLAARPPAMSRADLVVTAGVWSGGREKRAPAAKLPSRPSPPLPTLRHPPRTRETAANRALRSPRSTTVGRSSSGPNPGASRHPLTEAEQGRPPKRTPLFVKRCRGYRVGVSRYPRSPRHTYRA
jgi:hypothetical protein